MNFSTQAKLAAIHFAIDGLQSRLDGDIVDSAERKAYQREIARLTSQQQKLYAKAAA